MKSSKRYLLVALALLLAALLFSGLATAEESKPITSIAITKADGLDLKLYGRQDWGWDVSTNVGAPFRITYEPADATDKLFKVYLNAGDENVVEIDNDADSIFRDAVFTGIHARKPGTVTLNVVAIDSKGNVIATATPLPITFELVKEKEIVIHNPTPMILDIGSHAGHIDTDVIGFTVEGEGEKVPTYVDALLDYTSSNPAVAIVDKYGSVDALSPGNTTITVYAKGDPTVVKTIDIIVRDAFEWHPYSINKLTFTQQTFELNKSLYNVGVPFELDRFLKIEDVNGNEYGNNDDSIVVASSDDDVLTATYEALPQSHNEYKWFENYGDWWNDEWAPNYYDWEYEYNYEAGENQFYVTFRWTWYEHKIYVVPSTKNGKATVTVSSKNNPSVKHSCIIAFDEEFAKAIAYPDGDAQAFTFKEGKQNVVDLKDYLTTDPENAINNVIFTSSDTTVAKVVKSGPNAGKVTTVKPGTATITARIANSPDVKPATCTITVTKKGVIPTKVTITPAEIVSSVAQLNLFDYDVQKEPADADISEVIWSTSDRNVATVNQAGVVTPTTKGGDVTITAKDDAGNVLGSVKISFIKNPAKKIVLSQDTVTIDKKDLMFGSFDELSDLTDIIIKPTNTDDKFIITSSDVQIASALGKEFTYDQLVGKEHPDPDGKAWLIFGKHYPATATLTITAKGNPEAKATLTVNIVETKLESIAFPQETISYDLNLGEHGETQYNLDDLLIFTPEDASNKDIAWTSSDPLTAKVDDNGILTPIKAGTAVITATPKALPEGAKAITVTITEKKAPTTITVAPAAVTIDVTKNRAGLAVKDYYQVTPYDADTEYFVGWQSSDPTVAVVENGTLKPLSKGTAVLTASLVYDGNIVATGTLTVTVTDDRVANKISFVTEALTVDLQDVVVDLNPYYLVTPLGTSNAIKWASSDPSIAYVTIGYYEPVHIGDTEFYLAHYYLNILKKGSVTLTANVIDNDVIAATGTLAVTITDTCAPEKIVISPAELTVELPENGSDAHSNDVPLSRYYQISPVTATRYTLDWISSDPDVVAVENGKIHPVKKGTAVLTANLVYNKAIVSTATLTVTVAETGKATVAFSPAEVTVKLGSRDKDLTKYMQITPYGVSDHTKIYWVSDNPEVASVSANGIVEANLVGTATITATVVNTDTDAVLCSGTVKVNVKDIVLTGLAFQKKEYTAKLNSKVNVNIGWSYTPVNWDFDYTELEVLNSNTYVVDVDIYDLEKDILTATAKRPGTAVVTLKSKTDDTIFAEAKITVEAQPITKVSFRKNTLKLYYAETKNERNNADYKHNGGVYQSEYDVSSLLQVQPTNAYIDDITWETSNSNVAFVYIADADNTNNSGSSSSDYTLKGSYGGSYGCSEKVGKIIAVGTGKATISAIISDGVNTFKKDIDVIVLGKTVSLKLNKSKVTMNLLKGEEVTFQLKAYDDDTDEEVPVKWKSNKTSVATVDANGVVTAVKAGKAVVITATTKDGTKTIATCTITVKKNLIKKIKTVDGKKALTMSVGEVKELMNGDDALLVISPANAYNKTLKYSSDKPKIVKVDKNGKMTAVGAGTAKITIKANDGSKKSLTLKVTVEKAEN